MLDVIVANVRRQIASRPRRVWQQSVETLLADVHRRPRPSFRKALAGPGERFIFEIKRTAPSQNQAPVALDAARTATEYEAAGADAISVLTEPKFFGGSLDDLSVVAASVGLPLLRKDFVVDELQILEAKACGASAVLLIVAILDDSTLKRFLKLSHETRLDALVEVHDENELRRALSADARIIGVNNRNLQTLEIDLSVGERLLKLIPDSIIRVAESGINSRSDIVRLRAAGAGAFLIGTAVSRASDTKAKIAELRGQ